MKYQEVIRNVGIRQSSAILKHVACAYPIRTILVVACLLLAGLAEGLGVTLLLPLLQQVLGESSDAAQVGVIKWIYTFLAALGISPRLEMFLLLMVGFIFLKSLLLWLGLKQVGFAVAHIAMNIRLQLLRALLNARWSYFVHAPAGQFANSISAEAVKAANCFLQGAEILSCLILFCTYLILAFLISWPIALGGLASGALLIMLMQTMIRRARPSIRWMI
jgi:ATP-binding cassette subfamily C protein